jgi:hypothetical protein
MLTPPVEGSHWPWRKVFWSAKSAPSMYDDFCAPRVNECVIWNAGLGDTTLDRSARAPSKK